MKAKSRFQVFGISAGLFVWMILLLWPALKVMALTEKNWLQVNQDGFGYPSSTSQVGGSTKLCVFDDKLYAMNENGVFQMEDAISKVWKEISISAFFIPLENYMYMYKSDDNGKLWLISKGINLGSITNWDKVTSVGLPGGASPIPRVFFNNKVYGVFKLPSGAFEIWRSGDIGKTVMNWQKVVANSFNDPYNNRDVDMMVVFKNRIYVGTNTLKGLWGDFDTKVDGGVEIWESSSGDVGTWIQVNIDGFGTSAVCKIPDILNPPKIISKKIFPNHVIGSCAIYNGYLYVGTSSHWGGEVWRYDGTGKNGWKNVSPPWHEIGSGPCRNTDMVVFENELFLACGRPQGNLSKYNGTNWVMVVDWPPFHPENDGLGSLAVYNNRLYFSTVKVAFTKGDQVYGYPFAPVTLVTPNGSETWKGGTQQTLKWRCVRDPLEISSNAYKIEYSTNNGATYHNIAEYFPTETKPDEIVTYNWQVPNTPSVQSRIRVTATTYILSGELNKFSDISDGPFTITPSDNPITIRINAGGQQYIDQDGNSWEADMKYTPWTPRGYIGGNTYTVNDGISGTDNDPLYQSERWGMLAYRFRVPRGDYTVRLLFAEIYFQQPNCRVMGVTIEGNPFFTHLDLYAQAGHDVAVELVCPVRVNDGCLDIDFSASLNHPKLSAIEIISTTPLRSYRMNAGGGLYYDQAGNGWAWDNRYIPWRSNGYVGGYTYSTNDAIANTTDDPLYQSERWGMSAYRFRLPSGKYTVRLLFSEIYHNSSSQRLMSVKMEDDLKLNNVDIYSKVGHDAAMVYAFPVQVNDGQLDIDFSAIVDNPKIAAIEIISHEIVAVNSSLAKITQFNSDTDLEGQTPTEFRLSQNYPNPFNPITTIEYHLPQRSDVLLTIYNIQGQIVRRLVCETKSAGHHSVQWNGLSESGQMVASGTYIYRVDVKPDVNGQQGFTEVKRMILVK